MRRTQYLIALFGGLLAALLSLSSVGAQTRQFSPTFTLGGQVNTPRSYTLADLEALPAVDLEVDYLAGNTPEHDIFTGVRLYDLLMAAGPQFDAARKNDALRWYTAVTATDDYQATIAWGEIDPNFGAQNILVAYRENGELLGPGDGMARLVVPGDKHGGRYVGNIRAITLLHAPAEPAAGARVVLGWWSTAVTEWWASAASPS